MMGLRPANRWSALGRLNGSWEIYPFGGQRLMLGLRPANRWSALGRLGRRRYGIPVELDLYLHIGMDTVHDGAGMGGPLENGLLFFIYDEFAGEVEDDIDAGDPARIGLHDLLDGQFHAAEVYLQIAGLYPHCGSHTGAEGRSYEVGRGETLTFPLVVGGCVGLYFCPGLQVLGNRS